MTRFIFICVLVHLVLAQDGILNKFQICKRSDPKLDDCLKGAIQKVLPILQYGVEEFKIPSMQPMEISNWTVKGSNSLPFEQKYKDIRIYNIATATIEQVKSSITDNKISIHIMGKIPDTKFVAQYQYDNAIFLGQNLTGSGTLVLIETGIVFQFKMAGQVNRDGSKPTLAISSSLYEDNVESLDINLEHAHLDLSAKNSEHLNKNGELVFKELTAGYSEIYAFGLRNIAIAIFSQVNYDKVFPK